MWLVAAIVAVMVFEVISRYVFDKPTLWANELSLWLAGILYLFAGLYAMRERAHIRVTIFYDALPKNGKRVLDALAMMVVVFLPACLFSVHTKAFGKPSPAGKDLAPLGIRPFRQR